jgi:hypothetical protein
MGATLTNVSNHVKPKIEIKAVKESRLRKIILNSEIKPLSSLEYQDSRLNAYKAFR